MKSVVSVSLGSSKRNHKVELEILGENFIIERIGTDGDLQKAIRLVSELDGKVDCFGLGGIDLYVFAGKKRYIIREAANIAGAAKKTPIVDGSGLKNTLERKTIQYFQDNKIIDFAGRKVLMVCAMDRFGMAETLDELGAKMTYGDLIFALGLPIPLYSLKTLDRLARIIAPIVVRLPFKYIYPTGRKQELDNKGSRYNKYYHEAEVIAGDYHFIKKYMPMDLTGKMIITNTITRDDVQNIKNRGALFLGTTTPNLEGRSFGTNVVEAVIVTLLRKDKCELTSENYTTMLNRLEFKPYVEWFKPSESKPAEEVTYG